MSILSAGFLLVYFFPLECITAFNLFHYKNLEFSSYTKEPMSITEDEGNTENTTGEHHP